MQPQISPKIIVLLILNLHCSLSFEVSVEYNLFKRIPDSCPHYTWSPPATAPNSTVILQLFSSTRVYEDSVLIIEPDFTIYRPQNFSPECTYNLTYKWNQTDQKFYKLPSYENRDSQEVIVMLDERFKFGIVYDCLGQEPTLAEYKVSDVRGSSIFHSLLRQFGVQKPVTQGPIGHDEWIGEQTKAIRRCKAYIRTLPWEFKVSWLILGAVVVAMLGLLGMCYKIID